MLSNCKQKGLQKQNQSPAKDSSNFDNNNKELISELYKLLRINSIEIPVKFQNTKAYRLSLQNSEDIQTVTLNHQNEIRQYKIKLNDIQFELKKNSEDFAEYKVLCRIQNEKQIKKLRNENQDLKKALFYENQKWIKMLDQNQINYKKQIEKMRKKTDTQILQIKKQALSKFEKQSIQTQLSHNKQIEKLIQQHKQQINFIKQEENNKNKQLFCNHQRQLEKKEAKCQEKIGFLQKNYKQQIEFVETAKIKNQNIYQNYKKQMIETKHKLNEHIDIAKIAKMQLEKNISKLKLEIYFLKNNITFKDEIIARNKFNNEQQMIKIREQNQTILKNIQISHKNQLKEIFENNYKRIQEFEQRIQRMQKCKRQIQVKNTQNLHQLQECLKLRPAREQDIEKFHVLQTKLRCYEENIKNYEQQLRITRLQKDNNEKNYTRIFSSSRRRTVSSKHSKQKDVNILRPTHTTDLKFMLKICNKLF